MTTPSGQLAIVLADLGMGGVQRVTLRLAAGLVEQGHGVDLVVFRENGELRDRIPTGVEVVTLRGQSTARGRLAALRADPGGFWPMLLPVLLAPKAKWQLRYVGALARYLRARRPRALLSASLGYSNPVSYWAHRAAGVPCRLVLSQHNPLSLHLRRRGGPSGWQWRYAAPLLRRTYTAADHVVAVSGGVADDLAETLAMERQAIRVIYNPIVEGPGPDVAATDAPHPWLDRRNARVLVWVGRLAPEKDVPTLLRALQILRKSEDVRLILVGDGPERARSEALCRHLGVDKAVAFTGWHAQPQAFMARADALVLSSRYEGLPTVLVEAMAQGCAVVATACPGGVVEVLGEGRYGALVAPGDPQALAKAIRDTLCKPPSRRALRRRAQDFSVAKAVMEYARLLCGT